MKVLLLCAGYGTRLQRDLAQDSAFQHLASCPKPLLPVVGRPLLSRWLDVLGDDAIRITLVVNALHRQLFATWLEQQQRRIDLVCDGTLSNETRLGAVACIRFALDCEVGYDDHLLVVAGDTLLPKSFHVNDLVRRFTELNAQHDEACSVITECPCAESEVRSRGIIETDSAGRVTSFLEKPSPEETASRKQSPCVYLLHKDHLRLVAEFLDHTKDQPLEARDASGNFIKYVVARAKVYTYPVESRFDIGGLQTYLECCQSLKQEETKK